MVDSISKLPPIPGVARPEAVQPVSTTRRPDSAKSSGFQHILANELEAGKPVTFSAHAQQRLLSRQISLTEPQMQRLQQGVSKAAGKGARESLVLMDNLALVVSVNNRTVITAVDSAAYSGNVFTQIDSAVIV